jgi:hypothetical protein
MFKSKIVCEVKVGEKEFQFYLDNDSSLGAVHDALVLIRGEVIEQMKKVQEAEQKKPEEKKE